MYKFKKLYTQPKDLIDPLQLLEEYVYDRNAGSKKNNK